MAPLETQTTSFETQKKVADFFAHLSRSAKRALLLDYDGTLAPFTPDRARAFPYPGIQSLLDQIRQLDNTHLAVITGRRAFEVASLLKMKNLEIWGCHGLSRWRADGSYELPIIEETVLQCIARVNDLLRQEGLYHLLEFKPGGTAIHWRGREKQAKDIAGSVESVWSQLHPRKGLELLKFDGGMEIRAVSRNKGDAVRTILAEMGKGAAVAYLGDDHSDEDAFATLQGYGLSVLVNQQHRPTLADVWVRAPEGLIAFLNDWRRACGGGS